MSLIGVIETWSRSEEGFQIMKTAKEHLMIEKDLGSNKHQKCYNFERKIKSIS